MAALVSVSRTDKAVDLARKAFELLDLTPTITAEALASADALTATFPQRGCRVRGHQVSGASVFRFSGGESLPDWRGLLAPTCRRKIGGNRRG